MDRVIVQSVREELKLEAELKAFIEKQKSSLNLRDVLANPQAALNIFAIDLAEEAVKAFQTKYILQGIRFAENVKNKKRGLDLEGKIPESVSEGG